MCMSVAVSRPLFEFSGHNLEVLVGGRVREGAGSCLSQTLVITRPYPQAWGTPYNLIRARYVQKLLCFPPVSNIKVIYDSLFEN